MTIQFVIASEHWQNHSPYTAPLTIIHIVGPKTHNGAKWLQPPLSCISAIRAGMKDNPGWSDTLDTDTQTEDSRWAVVSHAVLIPVTTWFICLVHCIKCCYSGFWWTHVSLCQAASLWIVITIISVSSFIKTSFPGFVLQKHIFVLPSVSQSYNIDKMAAHHVLTDHPHKLNSTTTTHILCLKL